MKTQFMKVIMLIVTVMVVFTVSKAQCVEKNTAFKAGEKLEFTGFYNWGLIWVNAGKIRVDITNTTYKTKPAYQIKGGARNAKAFDMFFKLRDTLTTVIDKKSLMPYSLDRITNEGNYKARHLYVYEYPNKTIQSYIKKNDKPQQNKAIALEGCVNNLMSVLYYARNINYENLSKGTKIPLKMLVDGKISNVEIKYKGVGKVKMRNGKKYKCYKITPVLPDGSMFQEGDGMVVWLSKDKNKIPLMVEAKIRVGSGKGILTNYSGLLNEDNVLGNTAGSLE